MFETLICKVEAVEAVLADLPLLSAIVNDERCDGAADVALLALRDLLAVVAGVAIEQAMQREGGTL